MSAARKAGLALALGALVAVPMIADVGPKSLSIDEAVTEGLASDPGIRSSSYDAIAARARSIDALFRMMPSVAASGGVMANSTGSLASLGPIMGDLVGEDYNLAGVSGAPSQLTKMATDLSNFTKPSNSMDFRVDFQYPIFAGMRLLQAAEIAKLGALGKETGLELAKRAMTFEIERAYWEATRATASVETLAKALELEGVLRDEMKSMADQGMVTDADLLGEQARYDAAALALDDAKSGQAMAFMGLASLVGDTNASTAPDPDGYALVTKPGSRSWSDPGSDSTALIASALAARPETRLAGIGLEVERHAKAAANGDLMPTVILVGSVSNANADIASGRVTDTWSSTWNVGVRVRYDLGSLPGALVREKAAAADIEKAKADLERARNGIALDVRKCLLSLSRTRNSLDLTKGMVAQSEENLRVTQAKFDNGIAKRSDLLQAQIAVLRANFAVENKSIDLEIAEADLDRALARQSLP